MGRRRGRGRGGRLCRDRPGRGGGRDRRRLTRARRDRAGAPRERHGLKVLFDVSPLSHAPRTGVPNYILGSLRGLSTVVGDQHEIVPFAPVSLRGKRNLEEALDGIGLRRRVGWLPFAHVWRTGWSKLGRP